MKVYFDHNATTPLLEFLRIRLPEIYTNFGNPNSIHAWGRKAKTLLEESRDRIAQVLNCSSSEILFNSGSTEGVTTVIKSLMKDPKQDVLLTSKMEHSCVLENCKDLESRGFKVQYLRVNEYGEIDELDLREKLSKGVTLLVLMHANNEVGNIYDIVRFAALAKNEGVKILCDASQSMGKIKIDLEKIELDYLVASGHKFFCPKNSGFLFCREGAPLDPLLIGGNQEKSLRSGTNDPISAFLMAEALEYLSEHHEEIDQKIRNLKSYCKSKLNDQFADLMFLGASDDKKQLSNTINVVFHGVKGEHLMMNLDLAGIACSLGSACESGSLEASHVVKAMGWDETIASSALRISFSHLNTFEEIDYFIEELKKIMSRLGKK